MRLERGLRPMNFGGASPKFENKDSTWIHPHEVTDLLLVWLAVPDRRRGNRTKTVAMAAARAAP